MKSVVIAEKPSVGKEIARVLGCQLKGQYAENNKYLVTWAFGHLITLADPEVYDKKYMHWHEEDLPIIPKYFKKVVIKKTGRQLNQVKNLLIRNDVSEVIIATDAGREGELVARWILSYLKCKLPVKRLWISSVTDKAINEGFKHLKPGKNFESLYHAAIARAESDWLVGINATRALTTKYNTNLSCGRVQTPTLAMVNEMESKIRNFKPKKYFTIQATYKGLSFDYEKGHLYDEQKANSLSKLNKQGKIVEIEEKEKKKYSDLLYDLTELQRVAFQKYQFSPKQTLNIMQALYEKHKLLTYPRTDSRYLTEDIVATIPERLNAIQLKDYRKQAFQLSKSKIQGTKRFVQNHKVTDHHAIIPTDEAAIVQNLSSDEYKIYELVVKRFLEVLMPPYIYKESKVKLKLENQCFVYKGKSLVQPGFKILDNVSSTDYNNAFKVGEVITVDQINQTTHYTKPPKYFNEATLLTAMENPLQFMEDDQTLKSVLKATGGLGTVATRADIIEKLFNTGLIEKKNQDIHITKKGKQLLEVVPDQLKSPKLTAEWESSFQQISNKKLSYDKFVDEMKGYTHEIVAQIKNQKHQFKYDNLSTTLCPECDTRMMTVKTKSGTSLVCPNSECKHRIRIEQVTNARCPECHKKLKLKGTDDQKIFVCTCGYKEKLSSFEKRKKSTQKKGNKKDYQKYMKQQEAINKKQEAENNPFNALKNLKL
jgi:DNA topoisomerase-3